MLLDRITSLPEHMFWPDELPLNQAISHHQLIAGHRQITDSYLLALAAVRGEILATLDRAIRFLGVQASGLLELVQES